MAIRAWMQETAAIIILAGSRKVQMTPKVKKEENRLHSLKDLYRARPSSSKLIWGHLQHSQAQKPQLGTKLAWNSHLHTLEPYTNTNNNKILNKVTIREPTHRAMLEAPMLGSLTWLIMKILMFKICRRFNRLMQVLKTPGTPRNRRDWAISRKLSAQHLDPSRITPSLEVTAAAR